MGSPALRALVGLMTVFAAVAAQAKATVTFYGGAGQVGGSCALVAADGRRVLVDCGTSYGEGDARCAAADDSAFGFAPASIDDLVLTHAHQDHAGRIPQLVNSGFKGTVWMTEPTRKILSVLWRSSAAYDQFSVREWSWSSRSKKGRTVHWRPECEWAMRIAEKNHQRFKGTWPQAEKAANAGCAYVSQCKSCREAECESLLRHVKVVDYRRALDLRPFTLLFSSVKHLPGSAAIYFSYGGSSWVFSGDLGTERSRLVSGIEPAEKVDAVFVESTYGEGSLGGRDLVEKEYSRFRREVGAAVTSGGLAWIPAFALDRSQRVLLELRRGMDEGVIPRDTPIYYLSPSSRDICKLYIEHPQWFDNDLIAGIREMFHRSRAKFDPKSDPVRGILLTTTGMMDAGFSYGLLPELAPLENVRVFLVGYQSPGTVGYELKTGVRRLTLKDGEGEVQVRCAVSDYWCFSGHGDAVENDRWLGNNRRSKIYLIHGEPDGLVARRSGLEKRLGAKVEIVERGRTYEMP